MADHIKVVLLLLLGTCATLASGAPARQGCKSCPLHDNTVCGQDGLEYQNECLAVCQGVQIRNTGPCNKPDNTHGGAGTSAPAPQRCTEGVVTWAEMSDMHQQGYMLVARHKLVKREQRTGTDVQRRKQHTAQRSDGPADRRHVAVSYINGEIANIYMRAKAHPLITTAPTDNPPYFPENTMSERVIKAARALLYNHEDDREEVHSKAKPWQQVALYTYNVQDGRAAHCTAAMIGPSLALTAGHCVYDPDFGGYMNNHMVYPGAYGGKDPFGGVRVTRAEAFSQWINYQSDDFDIAILYLEKAIGHKTGWFGTKMQCGSQSYTLTLAGYPKDKSSETMWEDSCSVTMDPCTDAQVEHMCYTMGGNSGSPLFEGSGKNAYILLVHMSMYDSMPGNLGVSVGRPDVMSWISSALQNSKS